MEKKADDRSPEKKKRDKLINSMLLAASILLFIVGVAMIIRENVLMPDPDFEVPATPAPVATATPAPAAEQSAVPASTPSPTPFVRYAPVKISFVNQEQSCEVLPVGVNEKGAMDTIEDPYKAGWLELGPTPGEEGNAIIAGHKSVNSVAGTFQALWEMEPNDAVVIEYEDGHNEWFYAHTITSYPFDQVPESVMYLDGETRLTLITCIGAWNVSAGTSSERIVVVCYPQELGAAGEES